MTAIQSALYETILGQPAAVRAVLEGAHASVEQAVAALAPTRRVFLAGTGTSSHAAIVGEHLLRFVGRDAYATTNFDAVTYPRPLGAGDAFIAISHRGSKRYGAEALRRARAAGLPVVGIAGQDASMEGVDALIRTVPQERSATHTASYTASLAALAMIAAAWGERTGAAVDPLRAALVDLPDHIAAVLAYEDAVRPVAAALAERGRLVLMGAGPNAATAREGALKVKESSYLVAEGFELETALHGGLQALAPGDIAVVIAADGPALERTANLVRALDLLGAHLLIVADERAVSGLPAPEGAATRTLIPYPAVPEALSPLLAVLPLQLLAAHTAALLGTDADNFRRDDPLFTRVAASYAL